MKLGLLADIHEQVDALREALDALRRLAVDQIVVLGDLFESGEQIEETCRLLSEAGAIGVWGNHDFGLAYRPSDELRGHYSPLVIRYMTSLNARLEIDDCLVTHGARRFPRLLRGTRYAVPRAVPVSPGNALRGAAGRFFRPGRAGTGTPRRAR